MRIRGLNFLHRTGGNMFFYEDFIKKVEKANAEPKDINRYGLEVRRIIVWLSTGIPLLLLGIYQGYMGYIDNMKLIYLIFAAIFIFLGLKHFKTIFDYKIILNNKEQRFIGKGVDLKYSDIASCTLRENLVGKKVEVVVDIITVEKKQIIVPLMMSKKVEFVAILKKELGNRFSIIKG